MESLLHPRRTRQSQTSSSSSTTSSTKAMHDQLTTHGPWITVHRHRCRSCCWCWLVLVFLFVPVVGGWAAPGWFCSVPSGQPRSPGKAERMPGGFLPPCRCLFSWFAVLGVFINSKQASVQASVQAHTCKIRCKRASRTTSSKHVRRIRRSEMAMLYEQIG